MSLNFRALIGGIVVLGASFWLSLRVLDYFDNTYGYVVINEWTELANWSPFGLRAELTPLLSPSGSKATHLIEDDQSNWRAVSIRVQPTRGETLKVRTEVKSDTSQREVLIRVLAGPNRFSCNLKPSTGQTAVRGLGAGKADRCIARPLADGWWLVELMGSLSKDTYRDQALIGVALSKEGFAEVYQGDGKSGVYLGKITLAQRS